MRQYKTVARILLVLSVVNFTWAGLAQSPAMYEARPQLVKMDTTRASEKWPMSLKELSEWSGKRSTAGHAHPREVPVSALEDTVSSPKKFLSDEFKGELREDSIYAVVTVAVASLVGNFRNAWTTPADPGSYVFATFLPLLPTL